MGGSHVELPYNHRPTPVPRGGRRAVYGAGIFSSLPNRAANCRTYPNGIGAPHPEKNRKSLFGTPQNFAVWIFSLPVLSFVINVLVS